MNAVAQVAIGNSHYVLGGDALWSTEILGFQFSFTPGLTTWMLNFWGVMIVMVILGILAARKKAMIPKGIQNFGEWAYGGLSNFFNGIIGEKLGKQYGPILVTFFIFILMSNYSGMLPLNVEHGKLMNLQAPTAIFSVTLGFALIVFCLTHFAGFQGNQLGYFKHFVSPFAVLLPILLLEEIIHPFTLSLRLYGNISGEEEVIVQFVNLVPVVVPAAMEILGMLFGLIQALVFSLLAAIYISTAAGKAH
ncbi:MAG: F0F1 ATP synthase subunit A [Bacillota bacterium]|nr:F0F1 ATP synthase subunit A [Bacillota bacterium]